MTLRVSADEIVAADRSGVLGVHPSWERVRLGEVARVQNGFAFKSALFSKDAGMPLLRIRDVGSNDPDTFIDGTVDPDYVVRRGDIVIGMDGDFRAARWEGADAALNQRVCRVIPNSAQYDSRFLFHTLQPYLDAVNRATSAITVKHLSSTTVADLPLPLPPLAEQERIAAAIEEAFSKLDAGEAGLRTVRQLLTRMRDAVLAAAVTGRLVPQDPTDTPAAKLLADLGAPPLQDETLEAVPVGWVWAALDSLNDPARPICYGILMPGPDSPDGIPYVKVRDVQGGRVLVDQLHRTSPELEAKYARSRIRPGDLLVTIRGTFGRTALVPDGLLAANITQDTARVSLLAVEARYVALFIDSPLGQRSLAALSRGVAVKGVNIRDLRLLPVPVPPAEEQRRIVAEVERQFSDLEACERAVDAGLERAAALRRSVLNAAFEGRLVPQDPSDEPASVLLERIRADRAANPKAKKRRVRSTS